VTIDNRGRKSRSPGAKSEQGGALPGDRTLVSAAATAVSNGRSSVKRVRGVQMCTDVYAVVWLVYPVPPWYLRVLWPAAVDAVIGRTAILRRVFFMQS
jgi:hypothetical protein